MSNDQKYLYEFGPFRIDPWERQLFRAGDVVPLPPKAFDTLLLLARNSGRALDKNELMKELWPDTFVEEANLAQHISLLRKALGENPTEPQYIETIPRRGYRFLAKVGEIREQPEPLKSPDGQPAPSRFLLLKRAVLGLAIFAVGAIVSLLLFPARLIETTPYRFTPMVVDSSLKTFPAWSPSGRTVAYSGEVDGILQVFTKTLGASMASQITKHPQDCLAPFWSADGQRIYYQAVAGNAASPGNAAFDLFSVGAAGGTPELLMKGIWHAALAPDGRTLAVARSDRPGGLGSVWLVTLPGGEPRKYTRPPFGERKYLSYMHLQFSPDGSKLGVAIFTMERSQPEYWILPLDSGAPHQVLTSLPVTNGNEKFSWMPDSRRIVFSEGFLSNSNPHLFIADTHRNLIRPVTAGAAAEQWPAVSPDGRMVAFASMEGSYDIVEVGFDSPGMRNLISTARNEVTPGWSPVGGVFAYVTDRNGAPEIWLKNRTDGSDRPLVAMKDFGTEKPIALFDVTFSPDGRRIAYRWHGEGEESVWISTLASDPPVRLARQPERLYQRGPTWSPDGAWIAYYSTYRGKATVMKARVGGTGPPIPLPHESHLYYPRWSPTGEWIACKGVPGITLISPGGKMRRTLSTQSWMVHGWSKDGKRIYGVRATEQRRLIVASIDIQTGVETTVGDLGAYPADFTYGDFLAMTPFRGFSLAPDGKSFVTSIFRARGDIWLLEGLSQPAGFWRTPIR